jgi:hypothetical protein
MSQKRTMTKLERLYHEYNNKEKVKEELIELSKSTINDDLKKKVKDFNKKIDSNVLDKLTKNINEILKEYLNSIPINPKDAEEKESIIKTKDMIQKIYDKLSQYYVDLEYCYNLNLGKTNPILKSNMDKYLEIYNKNKKILNQTNDYYKLMGYDKCDIRILQNIRCCMRVIVFLSVNFNYDNYFGSFGDYRFRIIKIPKQYVWSKQEYKTRNVIQREFLNELIKKYPNINSSSITNFEDLRKIIGCDYYWSNNNIKKKLKNGDCANEM